MRHDHASPLIVFAYVQFFYGGNDPHWQQIRDRQRPYNYTADDSRTSWGELPVCAHSTVTSIASMSQVTIGCPLINPV